MDLATGLILGIVYVAAPGPISVETIRQGIRGGLVPSLAVQIGSVIGLVLYALLALLGGGILASEAAWQMVAGMGGAGVLLYLGITTIRDGRNLALQPDDGRQSGTSARHAFQTGAILSLANPLEILFWLALGNRLQRDPGVDGQAFLVVFLIGCTVTALALVILASFWHSHLTAKATLAISWICGLALIGFGLKLALSIGQHLMIW
jgi:threonine/homoserine/homoserine lactone efflux protein